MVPAAVLAAHRARRLLHLVNSFRPDNTDLLCNMLACAWRREVWRRRTARVLGGWVVPPTCASSRDGGCRWGIGDGLAWAAQAEAGAGRLSPLVCRLCVCAKVCSGQFLYVYK